MQKQTRNAEHIHPNNASLFDNTGGVSAAQFKQLLMPQLSNAPFPAELH